MVSTFWTLKEGADFERKGAKTPAVIENTNSQDPPPPPPPLREDDQDVKFRVGYTINLNLPRLQIPRYSTPSSRR
jgi:hypothetical protein